MDDLISRRAVIEAIEKCHKMCCREDACGDEWIHYETVLNEIECIPPAEPKRGKWIRDGHHIRCDQCGMYMCDTDREGDRIPTEFCPNCGAKMEVTI